MLTVADAAARVFITHFTGTGPGGHNIFTVKRTRRANSFLVVFEVAS